MRNARRRCLWPPVCKDQRGSSGYDPEKIKECAMEWLMVALELAVALIIALAVYLTVKK